MEEKFSRTSLLLGNDSIQKLKASSVAVFGIGGVGSFVCEALARSAIGKFALIDSDSVSVSNINRQLIATDKTVGMKKVDVMRERILEINPNAEIEVYPCFYLPENADNFDLTGFSYVVDAIDTVTSKLELITRCIKDNIPVISCMGAGNKLDPTRFEVADISKTSVCPLARTMRRELKKRGVEHLKVVYSKEPAITVQSIENENHTRRQTPGSVSFVPSVAGLIIAGEVIKDIVNL